MYNRIGLGLEPIEWRHTPIWNLGKWNSVKWNETRRIGAIFACFRPEKCAFLSVQCTGWPQKVSRRVLSVCYRQILIDFQNFFIGTCRGKFLIKWLPVPNIPPHLNCVATLPCEVMFPGAEDNARTYARLHGRPAEWRYRVSWTCRRIDNRAFSVACNKLPTELKQLRFTASFRRKTQDSSVLSAWLMELRTPLFNALTPTVAIWVQL